MVANRCIALLSLFFVTFCDLLNAEPAVTGRVIQFLTNAYTGRAMRAGEWLTAEARDNEKFKAFGGLARLVMQSTARAHEYKGLKSISIITATPFGDGYEVRAEVRFLVNHTEIATSAVVEREPIIWHFRVRKESGAWKLAF